MPLLIIIIGVILIVLNIRAINKEKSSFKSVFSQKEESLSDIDVKLGELRREFSETILELQKEIMKLKGASEFDSEFYEIEGNGNEEINVHAEAAPINSNNVKIDEVARLIKLGASVDEICEKLSIGKGEVLLIKELYIR